MGGFAPIFAALDEAGARYVVVGGLAVVLHGYARLTADVDIVVDLAPGEAIKAMAALDRIGMVPRAPVHARDFADPERRRAWVEEKGMRVFSMHDPRRPLIEVDVFVEPPLPFEALLARAEWIALGDQRIPVACIEDHDEARRRTSEGPRRHRRARGDRAAEGTFMSDAEDWGAGKRTASTSTWSA